MSGIKKSATTTEEKEDVKVITKSSKSTPYLKEGFLTIKGEDVLYIDSRTTNKATNGDHFIVVHTRVTGDQLKCRASELNII